MHLVRVKSEWQAEKVFEFETAKDAKEFSEAVQDGDLDALVNAGDVESSPSELINFDASQPFEGTGFGLRW